MELFRVFIMLGFAFNFSALLLTFIAIDNHLGIEGNPLQAFFQGYLGDAVIMVSFGFWVLAIFVYETIARRPNWMLAVRVSTLLLCSISFIDFLNDLLIILSG